MSYCPRKTWGEGRGEGRGEAVPCVSSFGFTSPVDSLSTIKNLFDELDAM